MYKTAFEIVNERFDEIIQDATINQVNKTAFDIVNEAFEKQANLMTAAKGLMTATKALGKNSKGLLKGVGGMLTKNKGFTDIVNNKGIRSSAANIGKGLILPAAGLAGANFALNKFAPKNQQPDHLNY